MTETKEFVYKLVNKIEEYYSRKRGIADVAKEIGISYKDAEKTLNMLNYWKTIQRDSSNLLPGKKYYLMHLIEDFKFLEKYFGKIKL